MQNTIAGNYEVSHFQLPSGIWYTTYRATQNEPTTLEGMADRAFVHEMGRQIWYGPSSGGGHFIIDPPEGLIDVHPARDGSAYVYRLGYEWRALNIMLPLIVEGSFTPTVWYDPLCQAAPSRPRSISGQPWCVSLPEALWGFLLSGHSDFESIAPILLADPSERLYIANHGTSIYLDAPLRRITFSHNLVNHRLFGLIVDGNQAWLPEDEKCEVRKPEGTIYFRLPGGRALRYALSSREPQLNESSISYDSKVPFDEVRKSK